MLLQDTTHLIQGPCYQRGSPRQDPAGIGPHEDILTIVKRRKLQWYGHVSCSSGLATTILQGTVKGVRRQGGQRKRWEDNIREWTGLEFGKSQRAVENGEKWRKLVAKSTVVPQWPLGLRDWWWWWWCERGREGLMDSELIFSQVARQPGFKQQSSPQEFSPQQ